jgi:hypothetical protein
MYAKSERARARGCCEGSWSDLMVHMGILGAIVLGGMESRCTIPVGDRW